VKREDFSIDERIWKDPIGEAESVSRCNVSITCNLDTKSSLTHLNYSRTRSWSHPWAWNFDQQLDNQNHKMASSGSGYDLSSSTFSPDGRIFQIEYAAKAVENSGTALGIKCRDGVVLAVEKPLQSKMLLPTSSRRIHTVDTHSGIAFTGFISDARQVMNRAREEALSYEQRLVWRHLQRFVYILFLTPAPVTEPKFRLQFWLNALLHMCITLPYMEVSGHLAQPPS